eukprot:TRINITY_DN13794_c0_g1_i1.p1 TRINITY_DN13794_c0_g1~~TRINITY_DN13794_c0_g1_i1.p1  ORF type:complete len:175 (+),score=50.92 TRINITY_DN13794_c0_g1_i1:70-594(+)
MLSVASRSSLRRVLGSRWRAAASGAASPNPPASEETSTTSEEPTRQQLVAHAVQNGVPMVGFGIVDCIVMTQVGSAIEVSLGASLGLAPIQAAAIGLFCSDSCGVLFGGTIESFAGRMGLPQANLSSEQLQGAKARRAATLGRLFGVQLGVILGSLSLLFKRKEPASKQKEGTD